MGESMWSIYALSDPRTPDDVRYIGATRQTVPERIENHCWNAQQGMSVPSALWVRSLLDIGLSPIYTVLETAGPHEWRETESRWIAHHRESSNLLNRLGVGKGSRRRDVSAEVLSKNSEAKDGNIAATAIGRAIRKRRKRLGLSLRDVAVVAELTESHLSKFELGIVSANLETIDTLCKILDIDLGEIRGLRSYKARNERVIE